MLLEHYSVRDGLFFAGEYPGDVADAMAREKLLMLVAAGVRTFIDLTKPVDGLKCYEDHLPAVAEKRGVKIKRISLPIKDMSVPDSKEEMAEILAAIDDGITSGQPVYVHCWGGIGRTGTVVGCWLREQGMGPDEALEKVQELYQTNMPKSRKKSYPESPQTEKQKEYVRGWDGVVG